MAFFVLLLLLYEKIFSMEERGLEQDDRHPLPRMSLAAKAGHPLLTPPDLGLKKSLVFESPSHIRLDGQAFSKPRDSFILSPHKLGPLPTPCSASETSAPGSGDVRDFLPRVFEVLKQKRKK